MIHIKGINGEKIKKLNRLLVLRLLCTEPEISRTEITSRVGLVKMTISNIVSELLASGLVYEKDTVANAKQGAGRKQMCLSFTDKAPVAIGIWLSRDFCQGVVVNMNLEEIVRDQIDFSKNETQDTMTDKLITLINNLIQKTDKRLIGIGISAIGPLDTKSGIIVNPPNFFGICDYPIVQILAEKTGLPVFLQNDMNASALAEKYFGISKDISNFSYIGITNGLGSGIIIDNHLFEGARGFSGEIGHMVIDQFGERCHCGNLGCLETKISVPNIIKRYEEVFKRSFKNLEEVCCYSRDQEDAGYLLKEICDTLSVGLINFCNLFDPAMIILGHEGASLTEDQLEYIASKVNSGILGNRKEIKFSKSYFDTLAPLYGAAIVVLEQVFDGKLLYDEFFGTSEVNE